MGSAPLAAPEGGLIASSFAVIRGVVGSIVRYMYVMSYLYSYVVPLDSRPTSFYLPVE